MFFSAKLENVIFDPSSCNELGITQARKTKIYYFLRIDIYIFLQEKLKAAPDNSGASFLA